MIHLKNGHKILKMRDECVAGLKNRKFNKYLIG